MKNCLFKYKSHLATAFIGLCLVSTGCTDKFEEINTDPKGVDDSVTDMVDKIQSPLDNIIPPRNIAINFGRILLRISLPVL